MPHLRDCPHARPMSYQGGQVTILALQELRVSQRKWTRSCPWVRKHNQWYEKWQQVLQGPGWKPLLSSQKEACGPEEKVTHSE